MPIRRLINKVGGVARLRRKAETVAPPLLAEPKRFPYGPFSFRTELPQGSKYTILASSDLRNWNPVATGTAPGPVIEYLDSDASKFSTRFYRVTVNGIPSQNALGFVAVSLVPGFSLIANPLNSPNTSVPELFKDWPEHTSLNKFDHHQYKLSDNTFEHGRWARPQEQLLPGDRSEEHTSELQSRVDISYA